MELTDKTILIIGASSGIGKCVAEQLSHRNNNLIITARRTDLLEKLAQTIRADGSKCLSITSDALDEARAGDVVNQAAAKFGRIDVALLNIGDGPSFNMAKVSAQDVKHNMAVNYDSMVNFLIPLIAQMKSQNDGVIAHTNSLAGFLGLPMQGPYSAAKAAARILLDSTRIELEAFNIRVLTMYPGFVATTRVAEDGIPAPFEISETEAAQYIINGIEKEKKDHLFPFTLKVLIKLAMVLPKPIVARILKTQIPEDY